MAPPSLDLDGPPLNHRFSVFFMIGGLLPNPFDTRFSRVSGLSSKIETQTLNEGGQNLYSHKLPTKVSYDNLTLERGFVVGSLLNLEFNAAMSLFTFSPSSVMVTLRSESGFPLAAWMFYKAFPVRWATADLSAGEDKVLIDTLELAYTRMQALRI